MSFPAQELSHDKQNCMQKCFYMMNLIRSKNIEIWEMYQPVYATMKPEESWDFYHTLIEEYRRLLSPQETPKTVKKKKVTAKKKTTAAKKPAAKKTTKAKAKTK